MADSEVAKLEKRVDELIVTCDKLKDENSLLRGRQSALVEERAGLIEKTDITRARVEAMLVRLKSLRQEA